MGEEECREFERQLKAKRAAAPPMAFSEETTRIWLVGLRRIYQETLGGFYDEADLLIYVSRDPGLRRQGWRKKDVEAFIAAAKWVLALDARDVSGHSEAAH